MEGFQKKQKVGGWSELPCDILKEIYKLVVSAGVNDMLTLRKVCKSWRAAATKDIVCKLCPYLMLPEKEGSQERQLYSLVDKKVSLTIHLPEAQGKRCIEARFGWLLAYDHSGEAKLVNPISRSQIHVPNFRTLYTDYETDYEPFPFHYVCKAVLSTDPSFSSGFALAVITSDGSVGFWTGGLRDWKRMRFPKPEIYRAQDVNYHSKDEKFYIISDNNHIYVSVDERFEVESRVVVRFTYEQEMTYFTNGTYETYLVESSTTGDLLLVQRRGSPPFRRQIDWTCRYGTYDFNVFRVDLGRKYYQLVNSMEDEAIFIGYNAAFSVPTSASDVIKPNSIYFSDGSARAHLSSYHRCERCGQTTFKNAKLCENLELCDDVARVRKAKIVTATERERWDTPFQMENDLKKKLSPFDASKGGGKDMGIFNLKDRTIERFHEDVQRLSFICPSLWISLSSLFSPAKYKYIKPVGH